jgi:uncharacterized glyoxalase superfamily protein PhnB
MPEQVRPLPEGYHTVTPHLICAGAARAIDFYTQAFGAAEIGRIPGPDGRLVHAELKIGDSRVMLVDACPEYGTADPLARNGTTVNLHLYVPDADAAWDRAVAAGARPVIPLADMFWGDRYGMLEDPFGHRWSVATRMRDVSPEDMQAAMRNMGAQGPGSAQQSMQGEPQ